MLTALVLADGPAGAQPLESFATPPPSVIEQLRSQYRPDDWLRVTMGSTQLELRTRQIDQEGLSGLKARGRDRRRLVAYTSDRSSRGLLGWSSISRIDELHTQSRIGHFSGFVTGGIAGANVGQPFVGAVVGGFLGAWLGGRIGDHFVKIRTLYIAKPLPPRSSTAAATSQEVGSTVPDSAAAALTPDSAAAAPSTDSLVAPQTPVSSPSPPVDTFAPSHLVLRASQRITPRNLLRIDADFGRFQGYALRIGPRGLEGLRADRNSQSLQNPPSGLVGWDRIDRLEKRGRSAGRGAIAGGVTFGLLGGMVGAAAVSVANGDEKPGTAFVEGALAGGAFGAVLGGLIGLAIPAWHVVYKRPTELARSSGR